MGFGRSGKAEVTNHCNLDRLSVAHRRSRSVVIDPLYDAEKEVPERDQGDGAPWLYGDGELESWRLHLMRVRSKAVCRHAGYPGDYHRPSGLAVFRLRLSSGTVLPLILHLKACGSVVLSVDGRDVYSEEAKEQEHIVTFYPESAFFGALEIKLISTGGEPPAICISDGPCATDNGSWQWSVDGQKWGEAKAFQSTSSGLPPHRVEQPTADLEPAVLVAKGVFDFGLTILGRPSFRSEGSPVLVAGESLAEVYETSPEVHEQRFDLEKGADGRWMSRHNLAFRYLRIRGAEPCDVRAEAVFHPARYKGAFACSDQRLTRIWMHCATTLRLCMNDLVLDGLKRDRLPWIGDQALNLKSNAYTFADAEIYRRTFTALGRAGIEVKDINGIVDYSLWWIINQDLFQLFFNDPEYLRLEWPRVKALLLHMESRCNADGLLVPREKTWLFIDWGIRKDAALTCVPLQILWFWALRSGAALAVRIGDEEAAGLWRCRSEKLGQYLQQCAWDTDEQGWRMFVESSGEISRHSNLLAVLAGLATKDQYADIRRHLQGRVLPPAHTPFMTSMELTALAMVGVRSDQLIEKIDGYWGAMLDRGATTFWESFDPYGSDGDYSMYGRPYGNSLCHAWASGPAALLPGEVLGIRPLSDGWKRFCVEPKLGGLKWATATVPTPHGDIEVEVGDGRLSLRVPDGTLALLREREFRGPITVNEPMI